MRIHIRPALCAALAVAVPLGLVSRASAQRPSHPDASTLLDQCVRGGQLTAADCSKWVSRSQALTSAPCPDSRGATACRSFRELLRSDDTALMNDLARQDHVYVCFLPNVDEFFKVTYSDPSRFAFASPSPDEQKDGVPSDALIARGGSAFVYYRSGVEDSNSGVSDTGNWIYVAANTADPDTMRANLNVHDARFESKHITISADEWKLTETYTSESGSQLRHTVALQLATGRFRQEFALRDSGQVQGASNGRCLIAPPAN
ncbi:MAG TPA: hypothetical protein VMD29_04795 [Terracidiphilus sp.]|nr:hypothetical protein [Terracidiphilus sp.]